jgi:hypothetical protein
MAQKQDLLKQKHIIMTRIENIEWFGSNHITSFHCHFQIFRP